MRKASLAEAKTHLSKLVDDAEHHGVSTLIHRHGKPSAVIVPLSKGLRRAPMSDEQWEAMLAAFAKNDDPAVSAVDDLIAGRR